MKRLQIGALLCLLAFAPPALADEAPASSLAPYIKLQMQADQIKKLEWKQNSLEIENNSHIYISGFFRRPDWSLVHKTDAVVLDRQSQFQLRVPITGEETTFDVVAIGPTGELERQSVTIVVPKWKPSSIEKTKEHWITASLGFSMASYSETRKRDYSAIYLVPKISYRYLLVPPNWEIGANFFMTAFPISSNLPDVSARFIGANLRAGYATTLLPPPWKFTLLGGLYFTTMSVSADRDRDLFGFKNMMGPQLYPIVRRTLPNKDSLSGYLKFSPISDSFALLALSSHEFAFGVSWNRPLEKGRSWGIGVDYAHIKARILTSDISSSSLSLSGSHTW